MTPAANAIVDIYNFDHSATVRYPCCWDTLTDANGNYQFANVATGNLDILAQTRVLDPVSGQLLTSGVYGELRTAFSPGSPLTANVVVDSSINVFWNYNLDGADGFRYDVGCDFAMKHGGAVDGRLTGAYGLYPGFYNSGAYQLFDNYNNPLNHCDVDGVQWGRIGAAGRQIESPPYPYFGVQISRKVFSPAAGGFARYLDILKNPTNVPQTIPLTAGGMLGAGANTRSYISRPPRAAICMPSPIARCAAVRWWATSTEVLARRSPPAQGTWSLETRISTSCGM